MVSKSRRSAYLGLIVVDVIRAETIKPEFRMHSRPIRANRYRVPESDRDPADGENGIAAEYHSSLVRTLRTIFEVSIDRRRRIPKLSAPTNRVFVTVKPGFHDRPYP
ncbi:hypothetical protein ACFWMR_05650 [Amycolatopsis thailandensis]|uniref:hypothetical protein n=1 Tax=Amycolatopsis thailandensis TaxID=589330 RepID=UPI00365A450D